MSLREILTRELSIPDFDDKPKGRRDAMKGMSALVAGIGGLFLIAPYINEDIGVTTLITGITLFLGYTAKGISKMVYNDINDYQLTDNK